MLIIICLFSCVISSVGLGEKFDDLISGDYDIKDRVKGIGLSILFSNIIMTVVAFITFIPPVIMALINYGLTGEDIPTVLHAFIAENAIIALILVGSVFGIIVSIYLWKYMIIGGVYLARNFGKGSGRSSSLSSVSGSTYKDMNGGEHKSESERAHADFLIQKQRDEYKKYLEGRK